MSKRKNVTVVRDNGPAGEEPYYHLMGKDGVRVATFDSTQWRNLGLKPLAKGQSAVVDLQVSGLPKKRKSKAKG